MLSSRPAPYPWDRRKGDRIMRLMLLVSFPIALSACKTSSRPPIMPTGEVMEEAVYDGFADTDDALPDCTPEMVGSRFWVRTVRQAVECTVDGQWSLRNIQAPDEDDEVEQPFQPRTIRPGD
jgi:hypothetical protein